MEDGVGCRNRSAEAHETLRLDLDGPVFLAILPTDDGRCRLRVIGREEREVDLSSVLAAYGVAMTLFAALHRLGEAFF